MIKFVSSSSHTISIVILTTSVYSSVVHGFVLALVQCILRAVPASFVFISLIQRHLNFFKIYIFHGYAYQFAIEVLAFLTFNQLFDTSFFFNTAKTVRNTNETVLSMRRDRVLLNRKWIMSPRYKKLTSISDSGTYYVNWISERTSRILYLRCLIIIKQDLKWNVLKQF